MSRTYNADLTQEIEIEKNGMVTAPEQLTELLGSSWRESRDITPELIFSQLPGWSIPIAAVQQFEKLEDFYREQASHLVDGNEHHCIAAALMGGGDEWSVLKNHDSTVVRMAVAQAADAMHQLSLIDDPASEVRLYVAKYSNSDVRSLLLEAEAKRAEPNPGVLGELASHAIDPLLFDTATVLLWDKPDLLSSFVGDLEVFDSTFFSRLADHPDENVRMAAANKSIDLDHPEIVQKVLQGNLSEINRGWLEMYFTPAQPVETVTEEKPVPEQEPPSAEETNELPFLDPAELTDGKTIVMILSDGEGQLQRGTQMTLEEANQLFARLDSDAQLSGTRVEFQLCSVIDGELFHYHGQVDLGDGDGDILSHMRKYNEFCVSTPEWASSITERFGQEEWQAQLAEHQYILNTVLPELKQREINASIESTAQSKEVPLSGGEWKEPISVEEAITKTTIVSQQRIYRVVDLTEEQMKQNGYRILNDSTDGLYHIMGKDNQIYAVAKPIDDLEDFAERVYQFVEEFDNSIFPPYLTKTECIENLIDHCKAGLSDDVKRPLLAAINLSDFDAIKQQAAGLILAYQKQQERWLVPEMVQKVKERAAQKDKVSSQKTQKSKKTTKARTQNAEL